jgi:hypothetical protein
MDYENIEKITVKKYSRRDKKTKKPKMIVTGKHVFNLQKLIEKK